MESSPPSETSKQPVSKNKLSVSLDLRYIALALLAVIIAMLFMWKPWDSAVDANARTIKVTGQTTLKAEPDEYVFSPHYEFKNNDKNSAINAAETKQSELLAGLSNIRVNEKHIKTSIDGHPDYGITFPSPTDGEDDYVYTLRLTVTTTSRSHAQEVQNYLAGTQPMGAVTPVATFSEKKRKELESQARDEATKNARTKADQTAKNLGFSVKAVKSVDDGSGFGGVEPACGPDGRCSGVALDTQETRSSISVQPGENEFSYSVTVTYYIK